MTCIYIYVIWSGSAETQAYGETYGTNVPFTGAVGQALLRCQDPEGQGHDEEHVTCEGRGVPIKSCIQLGVWRGGVHEWKQCKC